MKKNFHFFLPLMIIVALTSCFSKNNELHTEDILSALKFKLPHYIKVEDIQVEVSENIGGEVEPHIRSRFTGEVVLTESLYKTKTTLLGKNILEEVATKGKELKLFGISSSKYTMGKWIVDFEKTTISPQVSGRPISSWKIDEYVLSGSDAEGELIKNNERQIALIKERKKALLEKQKEEEKKKRLLVEQQKAEDHEVIVAFLRSSSTVTGEAGNGSKKWPFILTFTNFKESGKTFSGKMEWPSLNGVTKVSGNLVGNTIIFKEIAHIIKGSVALNTVYELDTLDGRKMNGRWNRRKSNWIWFIIQ